MEKRIDLCEISPEIIDAILALAEAVSNLKKGDVTNRGSMKMKQAKETENQGQAKNEVTFEMLRDRLIELARDGKRGMVRALLNRHGVRLLTELPGEKYGEVFMEVIKW